MDGAFQRDKTAVLAVFTRVPDTGRGGDALAIGSSDNSSRADEGREDNDELETTDLSKDGALFSIGTAARVLQITGAAGKGFSYSLVIQGLVRIRISAITQVMSACLLAVTKGRHSATFIFIHILFKF